MGSFLISDVHWISLLPFEEETLITSDDFTFACLVQETLEEEEGTSWGSGSEIDQDPQVENVGVFRGLHDAGR